MNISLKLGWQAKEILCFERVEEGAIGCTVSYNTNKYVHYDPIEVRKKNPQVAMSWWILKGL